MLKHRNGKEVCKGLAEYFKQRSVIEEAYGKALAKLAKNTLVECETGGMKLAWDAVKTECSATALGHTSFAQCLVSDLEKSVMSFKDSQKGNRKMYEALIAEKSKLVASSKPGVDKLFLAYQESCISAHTLSEQVALGQLDHMTKRDYQKIKDGYEKACNKQRETGEAYKNALSEHNAIQLQYVEEMLKACKDFEDAERDRITFLKRTMQQYAERAITMLNMSKEAYDGLNNRYRDVNADSDIGHFAKTEGTSKSRPVPYSFPAPAAVIEEYNKHMSKKEKRKSSRHG